MAVIFSFHAVVGARRRFSTCGMNIFYVPGTTESGLTARFPVIRYRVPNMPDSAGEESSSTMEAKPPLTPSETAGGLFRACRCFMPSKPNNGGLKIYPSAQPRTRVPGLWVAYRLFLIRHSLAGPSVHYPHRPLLPRGWSSAWTTALANGWGGQKARCHLWHILIQSDQDIPNRENRDIGREA